VHLTEKAAHPSLKEEVQGMSHQDAMYEAEVLLERIGERRYRDGQSRIASKDDEIAWPDEQDRRDASAKPSDSDVGTLRVGLIDSFRFSRECVQRALERVHSTLSVHVYATATDCARAAAQGFDLLIYHPHGREAELGPLLQEVTALRRALKDAPLVVMSDAEEGDSVEAIREMLRNGARGYIPTRTTGIDVAVEAIRLVRVGGTFAPFDQFLLNRPSNAAATPAFVSPDYDLTARQLAVLGHLKQGKANKIIAYELGMSESTVKVHVRNIMRKMGVTNRTQAAFRAQVPPEFAPAFANARAVSSP
jgi:DNA-binding NarL/FixJ family response regulator